jgi:DNA repair photolyase
VKQLAYAGVPVGISLAPVLPKLTDSAADLDNLIAAAADHGAQWVWTGTLHLEPAVRDVLVSAVQRAFPRVAADYTRVYGASGSGGGARYTPSRYVEAVEQRISELQLRYGLGGPHERRTALAEVPTQPVYVQERLL